jgi:hypothetical protein
MYAQQINRTNPGCLVLLLDRSGSMREPIANGGGRSKAEALADAVNSLLYELVLKCIKNPTEGPRNYYDVCVLGYGGDEVGSALGGELAGREVVSIVDLANHPMRVDERLEHPEGAGDADALPRGIKVPVWVDPVAAGGTPMSEAINRAGALVAPWVRSHRGSFPPIVINASDGAATDGDPAQWSERMRSLATEDGNVLFFNLNLSALGGEPVYFPGTTEDLANDYARSLFDMSSRLPGYMRSLAAAQGIPVSEFARGYVYNADMGAVVRFLQIGTATAQAML